MNFNPEFVPYNEIYLSKSWEWLNDVEIKQLTLTPDFTKESQREWFEKLASKSDYLIWGIEMEGLPVGACGLKNITSSEAEYWGYIGEKKFWNQGLGTKILDFVFGEAKNRKIQTIILKVWTQNTRAIKLYEKYGFEIYHRDDNDIFMKKMV